MRFTGVFLTLGWGGMMVASLMLLPAFWAFTTGSVLEAEKFLLDSLLIIFLSGGFIFSGRNRRQAKVRKTELLLTSALVFFTLPFFAALPLIGTGEQIGFWAAYFEAVSGMTTTGASIYVHPEFETEATLLWRALTGWIGGLLTLTICVGLFLSLNMSGIRIKGIDHIRRNENDSVAQRFKRSLKLVYKPYTGLTVIGFIALWLSGAGFFEAVCFTLNSISTTGFVLTLTPINSTLPPLSILILSLLMLAGALNFVLQGELFSGRIHKLYKDTEFTHFIIFILFITLLFLLFSHMSGTQNLAGAFTMAISLMTTTALPMTKSADPTQGANVLILFLPVIIGGMLLSTAGGVKTLRVVVLFKHIWTEMKILPYPSALERLTYGGRAIKKADVAQIWFFTIIVFISFCFVLILAGLFYPNFDTAWLGSIALLANAGGLAIIAGQPDLYANLSSFGHIFSAIIMVFGRLELVVLLALLNPAYWRSGN